MVRTESSTPTLESSSTDVRNRVISKFIRKHFNSDLFSTTTTTTSSTSAPETKRRRSKSRIMDYNDFSSFHFDLTQRMDSITKLIENSFHYDLNQRMDGVTKLIENSFQQTLKRIEQLETTVINLKQRLEEQENRFGH